MNRMANYKAARIEIAFALITETEHKFPPDDYEKFPPATTSTCPPSTNP